MANKKEINSNSPSNPVTLQSILGEARLVLPEQDDGQKTNILKYLNAVLELMEETLDLSSYSDFSSFARSTISSLQEKLSLQIDEVLHHSDFNRLEGRWRGLHHLVFNTETSDSLKIKIINLSRSSMDQDLLKAIDFDQSKLFKIIYEEGLGTLGGEPIGCIIVDEYFKCTNYDMNILSKLTSIAAACHAPLHSSVLSQFFNLSDFKYINQIRNIRNIFSSTDKMVYRMFREDENSRYCYLSMPRVMARTPYSPEDPSQEFMYREKVDPMQSEYIVYMSSAYVLVVRIAESFALYGWPASITGVESGGMAYDLPIHLYRTPSGNDKVLCPTEVAITDRKEREIASLGFIPLCYYQNTNRAVFFSVNSVHTPEKYGTDSANANSLISTDGRRVYVASRIAHAVKTLMRNKIGSGMSKQDIETYMQNYVSRWVYIGTSGSQETLAKMPLKAASVTVVDKPEAPGSYCAIIYLVPHFNFNDIDISIRTVARLYST